MPKLGALLNSLVTKSGADANNDILKTLLSKSEIAGAEVPDDIARAIEENLMTLDSAKNNSTLRSHFHAQAYNGIDSDLERALADFQLDEASIAELKAEKSTSKRAIAIAKKVQALEQKKLEGKGDKGELQKQINDLNGKLSTIVTEHQAKITEMEAQHAANILNYDVAGHLAGYNYSLPKDMPGDIKVRTAQSVVTGELQKLGLKVVKENGQLKLVKNDGTDYFDANHKRVDFPEFTKSVLDTSKLLAVSSGNDGGGNQQQPVITPGEKGKVNATMRSAVEQSLKDIGVPASA